MAAAPLVRIAATTAAEVCARFQPRNETLALLRDGIGPRDFVEALLANKQYVAGIDFLAHALPSREGIWWGCLCLQHAFGGALTPADRAAAIAAVHWVLRPGGAAQAAAGPAAHASGPGSVAGALASAVFLTSGNGPSSFASAKAVAQAVKIASIKVSPIKIPDTQRALVELGIGIAEGRYI
jgi:hypothetical protein